MKTAEITATYMDHFGTDLTVVNAARVRALLGAEGLEPTVERRAPSRTYRLYDRAAAERVLGKYKAPAPAQPPAPAPEDGVVPLLLALTDLAQAQAASTQSIRQAVAQLQERLDALCTALGMEEGTP